MNPAALKANIGDLPRGGTVIVDSDEFTTRALTKVGYASNPLEDGSLESYRVHALPLTSMTVKALEGLDLTRKDAERSKNMFSLGLLSWLYDRPTTGTEAFLVSKFARKPVILEANLTALRGGLGVRRDDRGLRGPLHRRARAEPGRHLPQRHRQHRARVRPGRRRPPRRAAAGARLVPDHAGVRHPAHALRPQGARRHDPAGRGRDRCRRHGARRRLRRGARRHVHVRPGPGAQGRDDRPGRLARAAARRRRRPARRAVDRHAHQDRAGRPAAGDVRPQRRGAGAGRGAAVAGRLLRRRGRGRPDRHHLPHPGAAALGRLPRQRLRAVARAVGVVAARPHRRVRQRAERRGRQGQARLHAVRARRGHPGPPVGAAGRGRSGAPDRRHREGATSPARSRTTPTTTS